MSADLFYNMLNILCCLHVCIISKYTSISPFCSFEITKSFEKIVGNTWIQSNKMHGMYCKTCQMSLQSAGKRKYMWYEKTLWF